ncbi:uncharacterized protein LOC131055759 [Cryptomeria japonica]|uniref:uncharacterized protein LOC131055759 n=1 Tax=Cryptomeria japonica TaxID=3369 RepID=UPI0027DA0215|nr:uncharacterized protein LOC131055759 [Cryptomeria japonica]
MNFDGSTNCTCQAGGGIIQDHLGNTVVAYAGNLKNNTITQAEGMALPWGLKLAISIGIKKLEIEGDSQIIVESVKGSSTAVWHVDSILRDVIGLLINPDDFIICHIFREGNEAADSMTVVGRLQNGLGCWGDPSLLPVTTMAILEKEKAYAQEGTVSSAQR